MKKINKNKILFDIYSIKTQIVLSLIIALLSFYTYNIFLILWEIFLISLYLKLPGTLNSLVGARIIFSTIVLFAFFQAQSLIYWALHIIINFNIYIYGSLFMILATLIVLKKFFDLKTNYYHKLSKNELVREFIIILTPIILISILIGGVFLYGGKGDVKYLSAISRGQDDSTHAGFFASLLRSEGNINSDDRLGELMPIKSTYPLGPHLSFAIFTSSVAKSTHMKVIDEIKYYFLSKMIMVFGAIYVISMLIFVLYNKFKIKILDYIDLVTYFFSIFVTTFIIIMPPYLDGFFSFLPALSAIGLALILLLENDITDDFIQFTVMFSAITISATMSWFLPVAIFLSAYLIYSFMKRGVINKLKTGLIIFSVIFVFTASLQALELYTDEKLRKMGSDIFLVPGGMFDPSSTLIIILLLLFICLYIIKKELRSILKIFLYLIYPTLAILMSIIIYLLIKQGSVVYPYYLYKTMYIILYILLALISVYLIKILYDHIKNKLMIPLVFYIIFLLSSHFLFPRIAESVLGFWVPAINNDLSKIVLESSLNRFYNPSNSRFIDAAREKFNHWNMISNNIARQSYRSTDCDFIMVNAANRFALIDDRNQLNGLIEYVRYCSDKIPQVTLYTDRTYYNDFKNSIPEKLLLEKKVILKSIN